MSSIANRLKFAAGSALSSTAHGARLTQQSVARPSGAPTSSPRLSGALGGGVTPVGQKPRFSAPSSTARVFRSSVSGTLGNAKRLAQHPDTARGLETMGAILASAALSTPNVKVGAGLTATAAFANLLHAGADRSRSGWARGAQGVAAAAELAAAIALLRSQHEKPDAADAFDALSAASSIAGELAARADQRREQGPVISTADASTQTGAVGREDGGPVISTTDASTQTDVEEPVVKRTVNPLY